MSAHDRTGPALTMLQGPMSNHSFGLGRSFSTIGRDSACDIVLPVASVSRRHARIVRRNDGCVLEDLGSTGGTLVNSRPVSGPVLLHEGDRIELGGCLLIFSEPEIVPKSWTPVDLAILSERSITETGEMAFIGVQPAEKLAAILEISRSLAGTLGLKDVLEQVLEVIFSVFPNAERALVLLEGEGEPRLAPTAFKIRRGESAEPTVSQTILEYVLAEGKAVLSEDVTVDARFVGSKSAEEAHIRTLMCVPLLDHERHPIGILQLDTSDPHARFGHEDLDLLAAVAGQIALAVNNARLFERLRQEQRRLEFLAEVGDRLGTSLDIDEVLGEVAALVVSHLADLCLIDLLEHDGVIRRAAAVHADPVKQPLADDFLTCGPPDPAGSDPAAIALRHGRVEFFEPVDDARLEVMTQDDGQMALLLRLGFRSSLYVPLIARGRTLGVLSLVMMEGRRPLGPADRIAAELMARRVALAVDNARLYQEMQAASRAKDRFLAVLSHELRTPLTPILLATSTMLDGDAVPTRPDLEMIRRNVALEVRLIDDLLDVVRIGQDSLRLKTEIVDVHETIGEAVKICREEVESAGLVLQFDFGADAHWVHADPARLLQVAWNLISNAAKFTPPGGTLTIRTSNGQMPAGDPSDRPITVEFRDTGVGLDAKLLRRIFEPFEQGSPELRGRTAGLGLGLTISRAIAEAHGGRLTAESPGHGLGSVFRLELPAIPSPGGVAGVGPTSSRNPSELSGLKVLLIEDNHDTLRTLAKVLRRRGGEVVEAASIQEARAALSRSQFDLLLSDIELPDGTGLELMRQTAAAGSMAGISMSGYGSEDDVRQSRAAGFAEHLIKPVEFRTLEEAIQRVIPPGRKGPALPSRSGADVEPDHPAG